MKVLGVVGSPRKDGNCDVLVKEFLDAADADTEYIFLNHKKLFGCNACMACEKVIVLMMMMVMIILNTC